MILRRITVTRLTGLSALLLFAAFVYQLVVVLQHQHINQQIQMISQGDLPEPESVDMQSAPVRIAYAFLQNQINLFDQAIETYSGTERLADNRQRRQIYYNLGNIYLTQAISLAENLSVDRATAMADVAKDFYRATLKLDPQFWEAKFNLEAAQRLSRDLPLGEVTITEEVEDSSEELWSAMPGFPIGLP